jgi:hypothetical protein
MAQICRKIKETKMPTVRITPTWEDLEGQRINTPLYFDSGDVPTLLSAQTIFSGYELLLQAVSGAKLVEAEVCFGLTATGAGGALAGYNVRSGAWAGFENSAGQGDGLYIPGVLNTMMINGVLDSEAPDVADLIDAIIGTTSDPTEPLSSRNSAILWTAFKRGYQTVRKLRR